MIPRCKGLPTKLLGVSWSKSTAFARFDMFGCLQISGIHTALTYLKTIIVIDRTDSVNTLMKLDNGQNAYGEELTFNGDPVTGFWERPLDVVTNVFCSTGQTLPDGTLLSIGGSTDANPVAPDLLKGAHSIRSFRPCTDSTCMFELEGNMTSKRWYPTAQIMPDGRVLIVGGADVFGNIAINTLGKNNPTVEYWPRNPGEGNYYVQFLVETVPFNLYPFVHLLPSGLVFMFAADRYTLFDPVTNQEVPGNYPPLSTIDEITGAPWYRSYPVSGSSAMFPLDPEDGYRVEIMICGGNTNLATYAMGNTTATAIASTRLADYRCWRIFPEDPTPTWINETMCNWPTCNTRYRRLMGDMVLLADGSVLILNGAQAGFQGLKPSYANNPQYQPLIYLPTNHSWYPVTRLPTSSIARMYHSSALLLFDATVFISGSNPNEKFTNSTTFFSELRNEKFVPPYLTTGRARPALVTSPQSAAVNTSFSVQFTATQPWTGGELNQRFKFTLAEPGFSTHNQRHGMRNVNLNATSIAVLGSDTYQADLLSPPSLNIAPPGIYWLFVLDQGVPCVEAVTLNITSSTPTATI